VTTTAPTPDQPLLLPVGQPSESPSATPPDRRYFLRKANDAGLFSGELLKGVDPERYQAVVDLLADGVISRRQIATICGVSSHTVQAIATAREGDIASLRRTISTEARHLVRLTLDRIKEMLLSSREQLTARDLAALVRELGTHAELLDGNPTARIAGETTGGEHGDYQRAIVELRAKWEELRSKAVPGSARMDLGAENRRAIGAPAAAGATITLPDPGLQVDAQSASRASADPDNSSTDPGVDRPVVMSNQSPDSRN
jgi:hypothetical protein